MNQNDDNSLLLKSKEEIVKDLRTIESKVKYYAITFLGTCKGKIEYGVQTQWIGWADDKPGREIRQASIVNAEYIAKLWIEIGEDYLVVNSPNGLLLFFRFGGNALIKKELAEKHLDFILAPMETAFDGSFGFKSISNMPDHGFKRAPRPKHRMRVLQRDQYRCRICGRSPDNYTDIELHVHHIRPWSHGGLTEDDNLITLCDTCHDGLEPHEEHSLFSMIFPKKWDSDKDLRSRKYYEGVHQYRQAARKKFFELENKSPDDSEKDNNVV